MAELIVALDVDEKRASDLVDILAEEVKIFKIGFPLFTTCNPEFIHKFREKDKKVFFDFKFHDIPTTVSKAIKTLAKYNPFAMTLHISGGEQMLKEAVRTVRAMSGITQPLLLGVTVLTSLEEEDMSALGIRHKLSDQVARLALLAKKAGLDGIVASGREIELVRKTCGEDFVIVVPGIRLKGEEIHDQIRTITPALAVGKGADYIIVGRPVSEADDPLAVVKEIKREMK